MRPSKGFIIRIFLYAAIALYVAGDLFWFGGPLRRRIDRARPDSPESIALAKERGVVATVQGYPIVVSQLERAVRERLWLRGKALEDLTPEQRKVERLAALNDLIDYQLMRVKVKFNAEEFPVEEAAIDAERAALVKRYGSEKRLWEDLKAEKIDSEKELRLRLGAKLQQQAWVESRLAPAIAVSEEEAKAWWEAHGGELGQPERVRVRQVFLSTLGRESDAAQKVLEGDLKRLKEGRVTFEALAAERSEDERSKGRGGELGWLSRGRMPADLMEPLMAMPAGQPALVRSKIGWHLVEVLEKKAAEPRAFEEAKEEVRAALESARREKAVAEMRRLLREREAKFVRVFPEMLPP